MALAREAYKALEDIVGPEYMTEEPVVLDGYCYTWGNEALFGNKFGPRPEAVVLPGSTEEIQAIVRVCNRYKIRYKAHGTGFGPQGISGKESFLPLDLRRMNRILEIDEKNMYAVIEPYVSLGALTLVAMKKGLRTYVIGAGPSCSVLASVTSVGGCGVANISAGYGSHNPLSVEWVLPDGEMLRLGSLEAGAGWFTGDGPGPSLRGVMRGYHGASGGIGIFTKVAVKLSPWYGPPSIETTGRAPSYEVEMPKCLAAYTILFSSRQNMIDAMYLMAEQGIAYALYRRAPYAVAAGMTGSNEELWELWQTGYWQERCQDAMNIVMDSSSPRELEYKEKVFREVVKRFNGEIPPELNEDDVHGQNHRFLHAFLGLGAVKGVFRSGGAHYQGVNGDETIDACQKMVELGMPLKEKLAKEGKLLDDGDSAPIYPYDENTVGMHMEQPVRYDPCDPEACKAALELGRWAIKAGVESNLTMGMFDGGMSYCDEVADIAGPKSLNYHIWIRKLKKAFDPNLVSESSFYTTPKD
jgi:glycolate oxidase